jgi:hypothetical protein
MANQFLVEIHRYLSRQIDTADRARHEAGSLGDGARQAFYTGKIDELNKLRAFISERFDLLTQKYF